VSIVRAMLAWPSISWAILALTFLESSRAAHVCLSGGYRVEAFRGDVRNEELLRVVEAVETSWG
jgi:hypothetical protein